MAVSNYAAGVLIALLTTCLSALGLALQKRVHARLSVRREEALRREGDTKSGKGAARAGDGAAAAARAEADRSLRSHRQPLWVIGIALMAISSLMSLAVFALLGQAVSSAMASVTILWNILFARILLHEPFTRVDAATTVLLIVGAVLVVVFGRKGKQVASFLSPDDIQRLMGRTAVAIFTPIVGVLMVFCILAHYYVVQRRKRVAARRWQIRIDEMLTILLAGLFSACTGYLSRGFVTLLSYAAQTDAGAVFTWYGSYLLGIFLPISLVFQVGYLNAALKLGDATEVTPQYQSWVVLLGVVFGYIYWEEGQGKGTGATIGFWVGVILILVGIGGLLLKRKPDPESLVLSRAIETFFRSPEGRKARIRRTVSAPPGGWSGGGKRRATMLAAAEADNNDDDAAAAAAAMAAGGARKVSDVPVFRAHGTGVRAFRLVRYGEGSVSAEALLQSPRPAHGTTGAAGIEDYVAPGVEVSAAMPVSPAILTAPARDRRYRHTLAAVALAKLAPGRIRPLSPEREEGQGRTKGGARVAEGAGEERDEAPNASSAAAAGQGQTAGEATGERPRAAASIEETKREA
jgi:hypothetical protein